MWVGGGGGEGVGRRGGGGKGVNTCKGNASGVAEALHLKELHGGCL